MSGLLPFLAFSFVWILHKTGCQQRNHHNHSTWNVWKGQQTTRSSPLKVFKSHVSGFGIYPPFVYHFLPLRSMASSLCADAKFHGFVLGHPAAGRNLLRIFRSFGASRGRSIAIIGFLLQNLPGTSGILVNRLNRLNRCQ